MVRFGWLVKNSLPIENGVLHYAISSFEKKTVHNGNFILVTWPGNGELCLPMKCSK